MAAEILDIAFAPFILPTSGALVLLIAEDTEPGEAQHAADAATQGAVSRALEAGEFKGRKGQSCIMLAPGAGLSRIVAIGLGKMAELTPHAVEEAGGRAAGAVQRDKHAAVAGALAPCQMAGLAMGAALRCYRFDRYRTKEKAEDKPRLATLHVLCAEPAAAKLAFAPLKAVVEGVFVARDLVSEPGNILTPTAMADRCEKLESLGLKIEILGPKELAKLGFGALLGVSQGSAQEPRVVVMQWMGASSGEKGKGKKKSHPAPIAFIGKGVTFDTGGISIKPAGGMEDMKWDMAGAGAVVGLMAALAGRRAKVDAIGIVGLVENMPSGTAQRPGDVVTTYSGQTVEIINTDAEGRMVLADVLWYCQERFAPKFMIDLATLTGAMIISLGHEYGGMFSNDDELAAQLFAAGTASGEKLWRMPLGEAYDKMLKSEIADMKHVGGRPGGAISAAQFIQRFVNGCKWAHLDIAGMVWTTKDAPCVPKGATAYGVRLLDRFVADHYEN